MWLYKEEEAMEEQKAIPPYMDDDVRTKENMENKGKLVQIDLTRELKIANEVEVILGDYEFVLKDGKTYFVKKKPHYPETYEECCKVLDIQSDWHLTFELDNPASCDLCVNKEFEYVCKLETLRKLLICRDAYWKIAGDWKPVWTIYEHKFCIGTDKDKVIKECITTGNRILAFPTTEIRDAFFENFKDLIEWCKELL